LTPYKQELITLLDENPQKISSDGKIYVNKKGWLTRFIILFAILIVIGYNLDVGIKLADPLILYSIIVPIHSVIVLFIGWIFYRNPSKGKIGNELVSVLIPIFNQEQMISDVIKAIDESTYKNIEIIAVNDGSKDDTQKILEKLERTIPKLKVINKKNEGKRKAVASGFNLSKGKFIVLVDSDSVIDKNGIAEFLKTFNENPRIGAAVGNARAWNSRKNILTKCQDVWYDFTFNISKACESIFGTVLCCSGCFSAYRREALAEFIPIWSQAKIQNSDDRELTSLAISKSWAKRELLLAFSNKALDSASRFDDAEDRVLTAQALVEWRAVYVASAIVYTDVPENLRNFLNQQKRWKKGYLRTNFFVSGFFWNKHPLMALIFYLEFMSSFTLPLVVVTVFLYEPIMLNQYLLPLSYFLGIILMGLGEGIDSKFRNPKSKNWIYKPIMNLISLFILSWIIVPALLSFRKDQWLTR
jgi:hyaluronan synthase